MNYYISLETLHAKTKMQIIFHLESKFHIKYGRTNPRPKIGFVNKGVQFSYCFILLALTFANNMKRKFKKVTLKLCF